VLFTYQAAKVKVKSLGFTKHHAMKTVPMLNKTPRLCGSGGTPPLILNLGTRWRKVVIFTPLLVYNRRKSPLYPMHRRLDEAQNRLEAVAKRKIPSQPLS
jgi:hypothetical protein